MNTIIAGAVMAFFAWSSTGLPSANLATEQAQVAETNLPTYTVHMTGYNAVPEQTNADPMTTASGARSNPDTIVARSRDLADKLPYGTIIEITTKDGVESPCGLTVVDHLIGYRVVADTMHPRKKNQIDIMFDAYDTVQVGKSQVNPAIALGVCDDIEVKVVGFVGINEIPKSQFALAAIVKAMPFALGN